MKILKALYVLGLSLAFAQDESVQIGDFSYFDLRDPITDEDTSFIGAYEISDSYSRSILYLQCQEGILTSFITSSEYLGSNDAYEVIYRFDSDEPSETTYWFGASDEKSVFVPFLETQSWVDNLIESERLVVRITKFDLTDATHEFGVAGAHEALQQLQCSSDFLRG